MKSTHETTLATDVKRARAYHYHLLGLTCQEIGKLLDLSPRTVERYSQTDRWREKSNPRPLVEKAKDLQKRGFSYSEIAATLGVSKSTVAAYVKPVGTQTDI